MGLITVFGPDPVLVVHGEYVMEYVGTVTTDALHFRIPAGVNMMVGIQIMYIKILIA